MSSFLSEPGVVCALGGSREEVREALFAPRPTGVETSLLFSVDQPLALGAVRAPVPDLEALPLRHRSRNNGLLLLALEQIRPSVEAALARFGPTRVGIALGTSTSGIGEGELAVRAHTLQGAPGPGFHYAQQELGSPARFLASVLGVRGPTVVVSTACSSSARALASAARWLEGGLVDAVVVGGADALCRMTIAGFLALDAVSAARCNPFSVNRRGINVGEAAALFVLSREEGPVRLAGWGETSDAHHLSAPDPAGTGAIAAMQQALSHSQLRPAEVGYVNLHGTGTPQNDAMESLAVHAVLGPDTWASSTKPLTGHTLGAAGALEAALCWLALTDAERRVPPHWYDGERDPALPELSLAAPGLRHPLRAVLSNSFAFGGSNATLALIRS